MQQQAAVHLVDCGSDSATARGTAAARQCTGWPPDVPPPLAFSTPYPPPRRPFPKLESVDIVTPIKQVVYGKGGQYRCILMEQRGLSAERECHPLARGACPRRMQQPAAACMPRRGRMHAARMPHACACLHRRG